MKSKNLKKGKLILNNEEIHRSTDLAKLREIKKFYDRFKTEDLELLLSDMDSKYEDYKQIGLLVSLLAFLIAFLKPFTDLFGVNIHSIVIYFLMFVFVTTRSSIIYSRSLRKATLQKNVIKTILENRK